MLRKISGIIAALLLVAGLAGCGSAEDDWVGTYVSSSTDYSALVQLNEDGTAYYQQTSLKSGNKKAAQTTWELTDGTIVVKANDAIDYDIWAEADDPDSGSLLFKGPEDESWQENLWVKSAPAG